MGLASRSCENRRIRTCVYAVHGFVVACVILLICQMHAPPPRSLPMISRNPDVKAIIFRSVYDAKKNGAEETSISTTMEHDVKTSYEPSTASHNPHSTTRSFTEKTTTEAEEPPMILLWNSSPSPPSSLPKIPLCGGGCHVTKNRIALLASDAVVFGMKGIKKADLPGPNKRRHDQVYLYWTEESAWTSKHFYRKKFNELENNFFNWTMTYRRNSDVNVMMIPYNAREFVTHQLRKYEKLHNLSARRLETDDPITLKPKTEWEMVRLKSKAIELVRRKNKTAAWMASNCGYTAGAKVRIAIVKELQPLGLGVDMLGNCGNTNITISQDLDSFAKFLSKYKFYLAFENSLHCSGYVTEKFWYNGLYAGVVPVVWGPSKSDVEAVAPPHSFIHYEDFDSNKELIDYLLYLSKNDEKYMEYFAWWWESSGYFPIFGVSETEKNVHERNSRVDFELNALCSLCNMLSKEVHKKTHKTIQSLDDWWYEEESPECLSRHLDH